GVTSLFQKDDSSRKGFGPFPDGTLWVPYNDIHALEETFTAYKDRIAGVLLEPIQGEGGIIIPDSDYLLKVRELCSWHNALLILDEIQTGFGRTGKNFAFEHSGVTPDILLLAKALGGGAVPASAILGRKDVLLDCGTKEYDVLSYLAIDGAGEEGATWAGSALVSTAILASIKELCDERLAERAAENGARFIAELKKLKRKYPLITDVRGKGLMVGVDFAAPPAEGPLFSVKGLKGRSVSYALLREGVWAYYTGETGQTLRFLPPLATPPEVLSEVVLRLERAIQSFI
ncbi:MAG: aspartate aminotransferase family protein, partial [Parcubacteria group bacterium]|nr:aspartate aminotransferase family protein [Parcubacteria group bacterium]